MRRVGPRPGARLILASLLCVAGCPRRTTAPVTPEPEPTLPPPRSSALVRTFAELSPSSYGELSGGPPGGVAVHKLARTHDADRFGLSVAAWGPPTRLVLQIDDQDHPTTTEGSTAGWFLEPSKETLPLGPLDPDALLYGAVSKRIVRSVLVRDWADAPRAADPFDLLLALAPQLPAPLLVCRPRTAVERAREEAIDDKDPQLPHILDPIALEAIAPERGLRVALRPVTPLGAVAQSGHGPFAWSVDHVEWSAPGRGADSWWEPLGFHDCKEIGRILTDQRVKRPRRPFGPPDSPTSKSP